MEDDEEAELHRPDTWMQSMVPSLPKPFAVACLTINIVIPGLGTFFGGILLCCIGRPRVNFRPSRHRCPSAMLVMFVGLAQFMATAFFLVGWLWSIMWGFLMLNLSDPKFRVLPAVPAPKLGSRAPSVKIEIPPEDAPVGRKNFNRLIHKATANKEVALGLKKPPKPCGGVFSLCQAKITSSTASSSSLLKCSEDSPSLLKCSQDSSSSLSKDDDGTKVPSRSESKQKLLGESKSKWSTTSMSVLRAVNCWKKISKAKNSKLRNTRVGSAKPQPETEKSLHTMNRRNSIVPGTMMQFTAISNAANGDFGNIVSITPATPEHTPNNLTPAAPVRRQSVAKPIQNIGKSPPAVIVTGPADLKTNSDKKNKETKVITVKESTTTTSVENRSKVNKNSVSKPVKTENSKTNSVPVKSMVVTSGTQPSNISKAKLDPVKVMKSEDVKQNSASSPTGKMVNVNNAKNMSNVSTVAKKETEGSIDKLNGSSVVQQQPVKSEAKETSKLKEVSNLQEVTLSPSELPRVMKPRIMQSNTYYFDAI